MVSLRWFLAIFLVVIAALVGGAVLIEQTTINRLLHDDAASTGRNWTGYLAGGLDDLEEVAAGKPPSRSSLSFLEQGKKVGQVFLYKIFNPAGQLRYISDEALGGALDQETLEKHNPEAAEAIGARETVVAVKEGAPPRRPPFYAETYVPVVVGGKTVAVVETYIDQTAKRAEFHRAFTGAAVALGLLIAAAFGAPAAAWYVRKRAQARADAHIEYLANFDSLSGLANRARLNEGLTRALAERQATGKAVAVHCVDIDRFKDLNDLFGLDLGDKLIRAVADRLKALCGPADIVARLSGDEFAIVQTKPGDHAAATALAERIVEGLAAPIRVDGHDVRLTAGVGVAVAPDDGDDAGQLLKNAELALFKAKSGGPGQMCLYSADLDDEFRARLTLERTIRAAADNHGFTLHFQPQFAAADNRLTGFEALIRLPTEHGFIPPAVFIPVAEKMGLIGRIGAWVIEKACSTAATWPGGLTVAVNLSPAQFAKGDIVTTVARALSRSGLKPERLELEITESLLMQETDAVMRELAELKGLGVAIVMDDFGTGYSSLSYLSRFAFDKIKIDRSFMQAFDRDDATAEKVIRAIVALGRAMNMRVNAEGVETARHVAFVRSIDCDEVQGFYFGGPAPVEDLAAVIMANFRAGMDSGEAAAEPASAVGSSARMT